MTDHKEKMPSHRRLRGRAAEHARTVKLHFRNHKWKYVYIVLVILLLSSLTKGIKLETFISATLRSEYVEIQIPKSSPFVIELPAAAMPGATACNDRIIIRIPPGSGAHVYYQRLIGDNLNIRIVGRYGWSYNDSSLQPVDGNTKFTVGRNGKRNGCPWPEHVRLPIYGRMIVGLESGGAEQGPSLPILSGQLHIFTKIIDRIWGGSIANLPFMSSGLYEADSIAIGAGSQLFDADVDPDDGKEASIWHGFADIDFSNVNNTERGMLIEASSTANGVGLVSPVGTVNGSFALEKQQDIVSQSTFETIMKDPNIHVLLVFLGLPIGVLEVLKNLREGFSSKKKPDDGDVAKEEGN